MKVKFEYITRNGKKAYAFDGATKFKSKSELLDRMKEHGRSYIPSDAIKYNNGNTWKYFNEFTKEELEKDINDDFNFCMKQPNDVFSIFAKYFGVNLYDIEKSDCFKNPKLYIKLFSPSEIKKIKSSGRSYKSFWHFMCGYLHLCPRVSTINFLKIKNDLTEEEGNHGIYDSFSDADRLWTLKIVDVLHKTFGDKQQFYFSKWCHGTQNPKSTFVNIKY